MAPELSPERAAPVLPSISKRALALIAGLAYLTLIVLGLFFNLLVLGRVTGSGDATATARNIAGSETLFRSGLVAFVMVLIADLVVAWALYAFFERTSRVVSLLAAWFRLVYVAIAAAALLNLLLAAKLVDGVGHTTALDNGARDAQMMLSLNAYHYGWRIGLVFFGVHLLVLGFLIVKANDAPGILGMLVAVAGLGYVVTGLASVLVSNFESGLAVLLLALVAVPGEFGLTTWLLWRAGRPQAAPQGR